MYNSIQHFNEFGVKNIEGKIKSFIQERKDFADLVLGLKEDIFDLARNILREVLEDMDGYLREDSIRKFFWEIVRKDLNSVITTFGEVRYDRTYFKPKKGGKREYLVDKIVGIEAHERVSADVVINSIEEATETSYRKGGENASYIDEISKQAVMNKVHEIEVIQPKVEVEEKKKVKILYIEADEDHVSLQKRGKSTKDKILMPRIVYVHEGVVMQFKNRKKLINARYFGGMYKDSESLWLEVADYIDQVYEQEELRVVYLSGDGAGWIKQGLQWIEKSKYVLDRYHIQKYVITSTAHLEDSNIRQELYDALDFPDKKDLIKVYKKIIDKTESETKKKAILDAKRYFLNNWDGIEIKSDFGHEIVGCSAEGHVSHILSDRLSSRPKGWSRQGADKIARLRIYKQNGGKIYDLVMTNKIKRQKEKQIEIQEKLIKSLRNSADKYESIINTNITVIDDGRRTGLYKELRSIIGRCG